MNSPYSDINLLVPTPWNTKAFGIPTYEIQSLSEEILKNTIQKPGHYSIHISPQTSKKLLHQFGFYYVDTLIEPFCRQRDFIPYEHPQVTLSSEIKIEDFRSICHGAFKGRFHRDFNIDSKLADSRYNVWLEQFFQERRILGIYFENDPAAFMGYQDDKIQLYASNKQYRSRGFGKFLLGAACQWLLNKKYTEISSSTSISNIPSMNVYIALGFRFRNPSDIYHRLTI